MKSKVSAVIANRNGAEHLRICLPSLVAQSFQPIEIVVVDNASSDDSGAVARKFGAKWVALESNLGLAPALNRGAATGTGDFLLFVNNDMRFDGNFVARLVSQLESDRGVFAADGMQFNWDGTSEGHLATHIARTSRCQMSIELVPGLFLCQERSERASDAFMASAASMLVRRSLFELLGGFDERLPLSYEDVEICWRAWLRGWKTMHVPEAVCWHRVGVSSKSKDGSLFLFRGVLKGRILVATKLLPLRYAVATWIGSLAGLGRDAIAVRWKRAAVRCREIIDSASIVPQLLIEKRQLYAAAATTPEQQLDFFLGMRSVRVTHGRGPELDAPPL